MLCSRSMLGAETLRVECNSEPSVPASACLPGSGETSINYWRVLTARKSWTGAVCTTRCYRLLYQATVPDDIIVQDCCTRRPYCTRLLYQTVLPVHVSRRPTVWRVWGFSGQKEKQHQLFWVTGESLETLEKYWHGLRKSRKIHLHIRVGLRFNAHCKTGHLTDYFTFSIAHFTLHGAHCKLGWSANTLIAKVYFFAHPGRMKSVCGKIIWKSCMQKTS